MLTKILTNPSIDIRKDEIARLLGDQFTNSSELLYLDFDEKLGVEAAKKIREHLSTKAFQGNKKAVVVVAGENFTSEAQNSLLKTIEEPPEGAIIIIGTDKVDSLLDTVRSRCEIIHLANSSKNEVNNFSTDLEKLKQSSIEDRFVFIEKLQEKEEFFQYLISHPRGVSTNFLEDLLLAEKWLQANGNIRAILEYLMLKLVH